MIEYSGYDFGYFVKLLTAVSLPKTEEEFFDILRIWFPTVYDIKFMMRACKVLRGGLQDVADDLGVRHHLLHRPTTLSFFQVVRIGNSHTAGSDSLLTASTFFKMREMYFNDTIDDKEYSGKLYGFGQTFPLTNGLTDPGRGGATIAEREDRGTLASRDTHAQTPGQIAAGIAQTPVGMGIPMSIPTPLPNGAYGPLSANGPYMRTSLVGGGR